MNGLFFLIKFEITSMTLCKWHLFRYIVMSFGCCILKGAQANYIKKTS